MKEVAWYLFLLGSFGRLRIRPSCSSGDCGACTVFKNFVGRSWLSDGEGSDGNGRLRCSLSRMRKNCRAGYTFAV